MTLQEYLTYPTNSQNSLVKNGSAQLKKGQGRTMKAGDAWIFDNEIERTFGTFENGDLIQVLDFDGYCLGYGYINSHSTILIRMLSRKKEDLITPAFLKSRVRNAWNFRKQVIDTSCCRVIFGEADFLPGFTVDKYEDILVVESLTLGMEKLKPILLSSLVQILKEDGSPIRGIYERSDAKVREKEGLSRSKGFLSEPFDTMIPITENGIHYLVDIKDGQKTGFFLDQKLNRLAIRPFCRNALVLDCFTHTGSFGLNAAYAGASHVTSVDSSMLAIEQAKTNARLNNMEDKIDYIVADVFDFLPEQRKKGCQYDVVILDPPALTKSRSSVRAASTGYRELNREGMLLLKDGGFLVTCSCSHFMTNELFQQTIQQAAKDAHRRLRQVEFRQQAPDHPILWSNDSSYYLKFYIFQVVTEQ